jgi:hypothetical protein
LYHSAIADIGHLRDEAAESIVYEILKRVLGKYFHLGSRKDTFEFRLSKGQITIHHLDFLPAARDMMTQSLNDAGIPLKLATLQLRKLTVENFFASDMVAGLIDHALNVKIEGVVAVLEPCEIREMSAKGEKERKRKEKQTKNMHERMSSRSRVNLAHNEEENSRMTQTFFETVELVEISKLHIRIQDPVANMNLSLDLGQADGLGGVKIFEPATRPKSFLSAHKENKGLPCPKQDCVKQVFFPMPVLCINPDCSDDIVDPGVEYDFQLQPKHVHVVKRGITYLVATVLLNAASLNEITIQGLQWVNELKLLLDADQLATVLHFAELLAPDAVTLEIRKIAAALDVLGVKLNHEHLELCYAMVKDSLVRWPGRSVFLANFLLLSLSISPAAARLVQSGTMPWAPFVLGQIKPT